MKIDFTNTKALVWDAKYFYLGTERGGRLKLFVFLLFPDCDDIHVVVQGLEPLNALTRSYVRVQTELLSEYAKY